jgi:predicted nucleic acid-binding protein
LIVVDTNIIAYLWIPGDFTAQAEKALRKDPDWCAPLLWRSEFRNILAGFLHSKKLSMETAFQMLEGAESHLKEREFTVASRQILNLVLSSHCSAYDCEFVALAKELGVKLVTFDKQILGEFPETAISPDKFVRS